MGSTLNFPAKKCGAEYVRAGFGAEARTNDVLGARRKRQVIMLIGFELARNIIMA